MSLECEYYVNYLIVCMLRLAAFFKSFRKGLVVCRGLDVNLSGKLAKKTTLTRKSGRHAHNVFLP